MRSAAERQAVVDRLLADPPVLHGDGDGPVPDAVSEANRHRFVADRCREGSRTLETRLGLSTALFAGLRAAHTCVTDAVQDVERLLAYCRLKGFATDLLRLETAPSHEALPPLAGDGDLDLVLLGGDGGFPIPAVEWFYAAGRLRPGGVLVVGDVSRPAVQDLVRFLDRDPRWPALERAPSWHAYERRSAGPLAEPWADQPFHADTTLRERVEGRLRGLIRRP